MNFAGGGHQVELDPSQFSIDQSSGHVTVRKDEEGIVTIVTCSSEDISEEDGQCEAPVYSDCDECMDESNAYGCWCNAPDNIYGSGGCQNNTVS